MIAQGLSAYAQAPVEDALTRCRETRPLWALSRQDRLKNLSGAIRCADSGAVEGRDLWLIDDVCTSGATLEACADALLAAGAASVQGYVFARQAQPLIQ